ncbi:MAG: DUF1036 domain-containing protein [Desulfovibrio sp.]|jgi:uncharacterized membrane protein|nr:DUF1036 domain-containing protein [Desulfovibrio sp.]
MRNRLALRLILLVLLCVLCWPAQADARERTLIFKNATNRHIQFALLYLDADEQWVKAGWFFVTPHGTEEIEDFFGGDKIYMYGTDVNANWDWPSGKGLRQTVRDSSFNVSADVNLGTPKNFLTMNVGNYAKFTWIFK